MAVFYSDARTRTDKTSPLVDDSDDIDGDGSDHGSDGPQRSTARPDDEQAAAAEGSATTGCRTCSPPSNRPRPAPVSSSDGAALVWLCPSCGLAWPQFENGDRGGMARAASTRLNANRRPAHLTT